MIQEEVNKVAIDQPEKKKKNSSLPNFEILIPKLSNVQSTRF